MTYRVVLHYICASLACVLVLFSCLYFIGGGKVTTTQFLGMIGLFIFFLACSGIFDYDRKMFEIEECVRIRMKKDVERELINHKFRIEKELGDFEEKIWKHYIDNISRKIS